MTADDFRELALSFPGATEGAHMGHPDFRADGRIFATIGYPNQSSGMVKLPLDEQKRLIDLYPHIFTYAKGAWGLQGSTMVDLTKATPGIMQPALDLAWQLSAVVAAPKPRVKKSSPGPARKR